MGKEKDEKKSTISPRPTNMREVSVEVLSGGRPIKYFRVEIQRGPRRTTQVIQARGKSKVLLGRFRMNEHISITILPEEGHEIQFDTQTRDIQIGMVRDNRVTFQVRSRVVRATVAPPRRGQTGINADAWQREIQQHAAVEQANEDHAYTGLRELRDIIVQVYPLLPFPKYMEIPNSTGPQGSIASTPPPRGRPRPTVESRGVVGDHVVVWLSDDANLVSYVTMFTLDGPGSYMENPMCTLNQFIRYDCAPNGVVRVIELERLDLPERYRRAYETRRRSRSSNRTR